MLLAKSVNVEASLPSDREIRFTCIFQRSARLLFEAWTTPEHLRHWWGCEESTITECAIDLRVGGSWSLVMRMADNSSHPFRGKYLEIVSPNRLVFTEQYLMPQFGNPEWLTTVTFDEGPEGTRLTHTIEHKSRAIRDAHLQAGTTEDGNGGMQEGMIQTFNRLDQYSNAMQSGKRS
jgi:uncharacterized protein YndB with AHSA1/START domain